MSTKAEIVRRVELIDQLSTVLKDLRRLEMGELERIFQIVSWAKMANNR